VFACISSVSTIWFWDDSKVSGTKIRNKTTGAYSGIPAADMRARRLKAELKASARMRGAQPFAAAARRRSPRMADAHEYM
jgi:hypothetical protein